MPHPALIDDFLDELMEGLRDGGTLTKLLAGTGLTVNHFYQRLKTNPELQQRYAQVRQDAAMKRADYADFKADEWIEDPDCPAPIRIAWLKKNHPGFRDKTEITFDNTPDSLERATLAELRAMLAEAKGESPPELESGEPGAD